MLLDNKTRTRIFREFPLLNRALLAMQIMAALLLGNNAIAADRLKSMCGERSTLVSSKATLIPRLAIVIAYGQSNATGAVFTEHVVTEKDFDARMIMFTSETLSARLPRKKGAVEKLDSFEPLRSYHDSKSGLGATSLEGFAQKLAYSRDSPLWDLADEWLFFSSGRGGRSLKKLGPGSTPYVDTLQAVQAAAQIACRKGGQTRVVAVMFTQGESDTGNRTWARDVQKLKKTLEADIRRITLQQEDIKFVLTQPSSFGNPRNALEQFDLARSHPNAFRIATPGYALDYAGPEFDHASPWLHFTSRSNLWLGEYQFAALESWFNEIKHLPSVYPLSVSWDQGKYLTVRFNVPSPPLRIIRRSDGYTGFDIADDAGIINFTADILDHNTIAFRLSRIPGANATISYALRPYAIDTKNKRVANTGPTGWVVDSNTEKSLFGEKLLLNKLVHFQLSFKEATNFAPPLK